MLRRILGAETIGDISSAHPVAKKFHESMLVVKESEEQVHWGYYGCFGVNCFQLWISVL